MLGVGRSAKAFFRRVEDTHPRVAGVRSRILQWTRHIPDDFGLVRELKRNKIYLCREHFTGVLRVLKPALDQSVLTQYLALEERFARAPSDFECLELPRYLGRSEPFDVWDYAEGKSYPFSLNQKECGYGGKGIPEDTIERILCLSRDLDRLETHTDFHWGNFIFQPNGKIAYVDWEHISYSESSTPRLSYLYCLMFKNPGWQRGLVRAAVDANMVCSVNFHEHALRVTKWLQATPWAGPDVVAYQKEIQVHLSKSEPDYHSSLDLLLSIGAPSRSRSAADQAKL